MVAVTNSYFVAAKRWARGWELHIEGVGVTQVATLSKAEATAREYIAFALDLDDETSFVVDVVPQLDAALAKQVEVARTEVREAERRQREAAAKQREVAKQLGRSGLSGREIAAVLGLTPQRVSQLIGTPSGAMASESQSTEHKVTRGKKSAKSASSRRSGSLASRRSSI
jgi:hypothetical protein